MPDFSRDTDIGYPDPEAQVVQNVSVTATITSDELEAIAASTADATLELKRLRRTGELILGADVPED